MTERPAFVEVPSPTGSITAVVASRQGIAPTELNGVQHVGLLLSVNPASSTIAVMTAAEAELAGHQLVAAAAECRKVNAVRRASEGG